MKTEWGKQAGKKNIPEKKNIIHYIAEDNFLLS